MEQNEEEFYDAPQEDTMFNDSPQYALNGLETDDDIENLARQLRETCEDFHYSVSSAEEEPDTVTAGVNIWEFEPGAYLLDGYWDTNHSIDPLGLDSTVIVRAKGQPGYLPTEVLEAAQAMLFQGLDMMHDQMIPVDQEDLMEVHGMHIQYHYGKDGTPHRI
jgi:hypothetical protein